MDNKTVQLDEFNLSEEELFSRVDNDSLASEKITAPRYSYWHSVFRVFFKKKINIIVLSILALVIIFSYVYPLVIGYDANVDATKFVNDPGSKHLTPAAAKELDKLEKLGYGKLPICVAKTQYSFSDNPALLGRPSGFRVTIRMIRLSAGAGFVVALAGEIMTMPGLPKVPAAEKIDVDETGRISGLF